MAESIYKIIELVGTIEKSWEAAAKNAVEIASKTLKNIRIAEIMKPVVKELLNYQASTTVPLFPLI
ncbi:MAG: hypothetical protein A3C43_00295 [Candidatus Schekmanbacteria bacterium RIFCSPHIGHO2_02_FULL_38_11]|uniref:Transporter n=1 Tax=Candidatus Schekmanbacteria bacterium RIFCSPLOWO2_12_FULL_38_15 TaxID=1817883 RepID=A0A1F7SG00_9BACT|nr:MAG: hypothetical protein A2043_01540 [Candidatus Schekmanbacteria bacterium GWA2_38_9]OGL49535.1 MAG: hypothetical protein A3H37_02355 [Candidatus Schekmanbacteria bacterium RIFCSPLOWO2_02_FULL_38_14]OGL52723.1 MAG: hypothetical protein A3G31_03625 [Candidatus Schekmanbacteria bacterium RIFCSPLOWO2_12_FULL_38_15]OGL53959.1 MAG: hypothetical protein A3C43_00295 [Candidatus Schekmanbacteria bacterium RIFCSPHIGHO2_02_FULL_38_11]